MKISLNHDTVFDTDDLTDHLHDLFARLAPATALSPEALTHVDDFTLRSLLHRTTAKRDTLNDAIALLQEEQARRHASSPSNVPDKL